jgi:hypothetical protein
MSDAPADQIEDFGDLHVRQTGLCRYVVLNLSGRENTAYEVNTEKLLCRCPDQSYNRSNGETCKHLAAALFKDNHSYDMETAMVDRIEREIEALQDAVESLEQTATATAAETAGADETATQDESEDPTDATDPATQSDAVEHIRDWLETGFAQPQLVDVRAGDHDGRPGVVLEPDNGTMQDSSYEAFKGLVNSQDGTEPHVGFTDEGCPTCGKQDDDFWYFVPTADALEVPES